MASGGPPGPSYSAVLSGSASAFSLLPDSYSGRSLPHTRPPVQVRHAHDPSRRPLDHIDVMATQLANELSTPFFIPSYLKGSRHAERLEEAHKARQAPKHTRSNPSSAPGSLSTSSSSVNLQKMVPSHRGMTHEIIERAPPFVEESLSPLPTRWSETDKNPGLEFPSPEGLDVKFGGAVKAAENEAMAIRADHPMPRQCGLYYYEVTVMSKGKEVMIGVGFSERAVPLNRLPGWEPNSWAYHGDDGFTFACTSTGHEFGPKFSYGDVVGCGINFRTGAAFFTRNGHLIGRALKDIRADKLYPSVGMKKPGEHLKANFGQTPFVFDIDSMMAEEKATIYEEANSADVKSLRPGLDENALIQQLISQYLAHDGYVDTARAFNQEARDLAKALSSDNSSTMKGFDVEDDHEAVNRQRIRSALLEGDVDKALKLTNAFYPNALKENENIYFQLKRRKFIEMIKKKTELQSPSSRQGSGTNGHSNDYEGVFDHQMELDEQLNGNGGSDWDRMDTEDGDTQMKIARMNEEILRYGQELKLEFSKDPRREVTKSLNAAFGLIAWPDPRESPIGAMLDDDERLSVAEELNSAILVSLGKSSAAALERLCQQTEVLVGELSEDGGAGAFVNVRKDFLR